LVRKSPLERHCQRGYRDVSHKKIIKSIDRDVESVNLPQ
jgi:hypothetical protein